MEYSQGSYTNSKHEKCVKALLIKNGFTESKLKGISKKRKAEVLKTNNFPELNEMEFICQPVGNNNSPDFIVVFKNLPYFIECKSSKGIYPVFNGGMPIEDNIYIFSGCKYNSTTIFYGRDILPESIRKMLNKITIEIKKIANEFNKELKNDRSNNRGFAFYCRNMYIQLGGNKNVNYFTHKNRDECERNVLDTFR